MCLQRKNIDKKYVTHITKTKKIKKTKMYLNEIMAEK